MSAIVAHSSALSQEDHFQLVHTLCKCRLLQLPNADSRCETTLGDAIYGSLVAVSVLAAVQVTLSCA